MLPNSETTRAINVSDHCSCLIDFFMPPFPCPSWHRLMVAPFLFAMHESKYSSISSSNRRKEEQLALSSETQCVWCHTVHASGCCHGACACALLGLPPLSCCSLRACLSAPVFEPRLVRYKQQHSTQGTTPCPILSLVPGLAQPKGRWGLQLRKATSSQDTPPVRSRPSFYSLSHLPWSCLGVENSMNTQSSH